MGGRRAPGAAQRAGLADEEARVVLVGVADRAVDLEGDPRGEVGGLRRRRLRGGDIAREVGGAVCQGRAEQQGAGVLQRDVGVREVVLHRLELADRAAELPARLRVLDGDPQQAVPDPGQLGGACQRTHVVRGGDIRAGHVEQGVAGSHGEQAAGRVQ